MEENLRNFYEQNKDKLMPKGAHNLYLIQSVDRDGNVTDEKYGINIFTNYGFQKVYCNQVNSAGCSNIYIGRGTEEITLSDEPKILPENLITTKKLTLTTDNSSAYNRTKGIQYMMYNRENGVMTGVRLIFVGYYDYNISGITTDEEVTEIGCGEDQNNLYIHACIYDKDGNRSSITKKVNERLTISIYGCINVNKDVIQKMYDEKGAYLLIDPSSMLVFVENYNYTNFGYITGFLRTRSIERVNTSLERKYYDRKPTKYFTEDNDDLMAKHSIWSDSFMMEDKRDYFDSSYFSTDGRIYIYNYSANGGHFEGFVHGDSYILLIKRDKLPEYEQIESDAIFTNSLTSSYITNSFGLNYNNSWNVGELPCVDFIIDRMCMYNHNTKEWDIEEDFVSSDYDYTLEKMVYYINMNVIHEGVAKSFHCYVNMDTSVPIKSFNNPQITNQFYATDEYWDPSTYEIIPQILNIPTNLNNKRYYVCTPAVEQDSKLGWLNVVRDYEKHRLIPKNDIIDTGVTINLYDNGNYRVPTYSYATKSHPIVNDGKGWIILSENIVFPFEEGGGVVYPFIPRTGNYQYTQDIFPTQDGNKIFIKCSDYGTYVDTRQSRLYDITNSPEQEPTYVDFNLIFSSNNTGHITSMTNQGRVIVSRTDGVKETIFFDVNNVDEDGLPIQTKRTDINLAFIINETECCVYQKYQVSDETFEIYDMENDEVIDTFELDITDYNILGLRGWKTKIFIGVTDKGNTSLCSTFVYDYVSHEFFSLPYALPVYHRQSHMYTKSNNECIFFCNSDDTTTYRSAFITEENIQSPLFMPSSQASRFQMKYMNYDKQLICLCNNTNSGCNINIFDLGYMLDHNEIDAYHCGTYNRMNDYVNNKNYRYFALIREYVLFVSSQNETIKLYPIENAIPHKIVGRTKTIQSWNNPKKINSRRCDIKFTNNCDRFDDVWEEE